ncbi:AAA family ATPase [Vibrio parahaemolyticus]|uniref:division plane positioning ATPase MipZ n=1 Tax=Vibrio parahaemolyticus TaxID=670 RepID=UPI00050C83D4|nr:division plane positioning ATPase MipZ [Vibrio parahaemolyticus]EKB1992589.1 AAA family ATPase [Vibrio parahaemolyticus]EME0136075.1 AAA family ATPase [Vibrio parahaemolyticus]MCC3859412.1 AAA family ATPase [Vibrio parahaemolyticus]
MIILLGSQKGGCGKSTLAVNIAGQLAHMGKDVCLLDADRQGSASEWIEYREEADVPITIHSVSKYGNISEALTDLKQRYEYVVCDVAGRDSKELRYGMLAADILVSPLRPSQPDINTIPNLTEIFEQAKTMNPDLRGLLVLNLCPTLPTIKEADQSAEYLEGLDGFSLAVVRIHDRKAYRDAFSEGLCVAEWKDQKAKNEIEWLVNEVCEW